VHIVQSVAARLADRLRVLSCGLCERQAMAAEILFLRRQLALLVERGARQRRLRPLDRVRLAGLARLVRSWRDALLVVRPEMLVR
jgi:RNase adaptor protein for sRNA GlmZ degradation